MYFLVSIYVYCIIGLFIFVAQNINPRSVDSLNKPSAATLYTQPSLSYEDLKNSFTITLPTFASNLKREFKINDSVFAWGNYVRKRIELASEIDTLNTTSTKYRLLPSNEAIFIIRDYQNQIIGYVRLNGKPSFFKDIDSFTLFNESNEPILKSKYLIFYHPQLRKDVFGFTSSNSGDQNIAYGYFHISAGINFRIQFLDIQNLISNVPLNLFLSHTQIALSPGFIMRGGYRFKSHGDIHIDDLNAFFEGTYDGDLFETMSNNMGEPNDNDDEEEILMSEVWTELKETLESTTPRITLDKAEREAIAATLSERFEDENGEVDPQEILDSLYELSDEQKSLILEVISSPINHEQLSVETISD